MGLPSHASLIVGLILALVTAAAFNWSWVVQHSITSKLPPLTLRHPWHSLGLLFGHRRWLIAFLSVSLAGGASDSTTGSWEAVAAWFVVSFAVAGIAIGPAASFLAPGAGFGIAAGVVYAAADVGTKEAVHGGTLILFGAPVWGCHLLAFSLIQLAFQRGRALATAGLSSFCTNAIPIAAGITIYHETTPPGVLGVLRFVAFGCVVFGAAAVARREKPAIEESMPALAAEIPLSAPATE